MGMPGRTPSAAATSARSPPAASAEPSTGGSQPGSTVQRSASQPDHSPRAMSSSHVEAASLTSVVASPVKRIRT